MIDVSEKTETLRTAAASLFIVVNSLAGLFGQLSKGVPDLLFLLPLSAAVIVGGQLGSRLGSRTLSELVVQRVTAVLILVVAVRLLGGLIGACRNNAPAANGPGICLTASDFAKSPRRSAGLRLRAFCSSSLSCSAMAILAFVDYPDRLL